MHILVNCTLSLRLKSWIFREIRRTLFALKLTMMTIANQPAAAPVTFIYPLLQ
jgi:hypothetical protein